jgi:hypothetical protein
MIYSFLMASRNQLVEIIEGQTLCLGLALPSDWDDGLQLNGLDKELAVAVQGHPMALGMVYLSQGTPLAWEGGGPRGIVICA